MAAGVMERYETLARRARQAVAAQQGGQSIWIQVGSATCENAAGAEGVWDEFRKHIRASGRADVGLRRAGCTGRCSCEPIVGVFRPGAMPIQYQRVNREIVHEIFTEHVQAGRPVGKHLLQSAGGREAAVPGHEFLFCTSGRCCGLKERDYRQMFAARLAAQGVGPPEAVVIEANCFGLCQLGQAGAWGFVLVRPGNVIYRLRDERDADEIIEAHVRGGRAVERLRVEEEPIGQRFFEMYGDVAFLNRQSRLALRNGGIVDPESIEEYFGFQGFAALARVLEKGDPEWVIGQVRQAKLRGRGGGGYPTADKWALGRAAAGEQKFVICNADEGDPGAFMDRSMLEGDPFSVLEGMVIGAFAVGARQGYYYVRAEYPMAIRRIENALGRAREWGLLGKDILGSGFDFDLEVRLGAGAFVCGEETALIHSIEGARGQPGVRPPYPTERGLWGQPTVINNVETFANVPVIFYYGADWFAKIGTDQSGGTKVFALAGKVKHTGLVEVPMGTTLREVVYDIGGGVAKGKQLKAIQTGGPAGGCIPAQWLETRVDFDTLQAAGSIMGSGGMIVMDEDDCMVDIAQFFLRFSQSESCGKCTPCREGTKRMLEIVERITAGQGREDDLAKLERLARLVKKTSLCGLGRAAPNPVLSTLAHFRAEYEAHVQEKRCPARKCVALIHYEIDPAKCVGCTMCARNCPAACISGAPRQAHVIDQARCIKCGRCYAVCRFEAVQRR